VSEEPARDRAFFGIGAMAGSVKSGSEHDVSSFSSRVLVSWFIKLISTIYAVCDEKYSNALRTASEQRNDAALCVSSGGFLLHRKNEVIASAAAVVCFEDVAANQ